MYLWSPIVMYVCTPCLLYPGCTMYVWLVVQPCGCGLVSLRHSKWKVNVCVSLSCDPVCIDVSLKVALPAASLCSAVTVLQYPVASKTCTCLGHIIFRIGKWSRLRLQRDCRLLHLFMENFIKWVGLNLNSSMHDFSRLYLVCTGCRDGEVWR